MDDSIDWQEVKCEDAQVQLGALADVLTFFS